jgi:hypothetical protein
MGILYHYCMEIKLILFSLFVVGLLLIVSCTSEPKIEPSVPVIYIAGQTAEEPQVKTFVVGEKSDLAWYEETKQQRYEQNVRRFMDEYGDEQEEFKLKSKLSNVRRAVGGELIIGYDEELDNPRWKEVDY